MDDLIDALRSYRQADADGVMVLVSRQACDEAANEIKRLRGLVSDYESMQEQHREHVRRLDVALNGDGAAKQASLIDLVSQFEHKR
ncbi:MAG: hypothetical protein KDJ47_14975 [Hyphomicrobiaceae bacterium]|nr:hypothetical protein [Hyphomicrobiaceae bacterium]